MAITSLRKARVVSMTITSLQHSSEHLACTVKHWSVQTSAIPDISAAPKLTFVPSPQPQESHRGKLSKLLLFIPGAITFGLGTWQIFRRQAKITMLEHKQKRFEMEPLQLTQVSSLGKELGSLEFRRIKCKGLFDEKRSLYIGPRSRSISGVTENGYYLITPLMPVPNDPESVQTPVLVNRGWVPRSWRDDYIKVAQGVKQPSDQKVAQGVEQPSNLTSSPAGESENSWWKFWSQKPKIIEVVHCSSHKVEAVTPVEVVGIVRDSENPSIYVPANEPSSLQWFYVDVPAISRATELPEDVLYIEGTNDHVNPSNPYPIPKEANALIRSSVMPQDHLRYTLTWYSLSAGVTYMAFLRIRPKKIRR